MATTPSDKPPSRAAFPGDRATAPTPLEDASEEAWDEFVRLHSGGGPVTEAGHPRDAAGEAPAGSQATLESTILLVRRGNRAAPVFARWQQLEAILPRNSPEPRPEFGEAEWNALSPMDKRLLLRRRIEWAVAAGALPAVHALLASLPEDEWEHL